MEHAPISGSYLAAEGVKPYETLPGLRLSAATCYSPGRGDETCPVHLAGVAEAPTMPQAVGMEQGG